MVDEGTPTKYGTVQAKPYKRFFVQMLTRDILLTDAILDLVDNCVDGILRSASQLEDDTPYASFSVKIKYSAESFEISDNCGGIPWELLCHGAFRIGGRPQGTVDPIGTVGTYGIGMKRAIFKIGRHAFVSTKAKNEGDEYEIEISPDWLSDEDVWDLVAKAVDTKKSVDGTTIKVGELHEEIASQFGPDEAAFTTQLIRKIATHYSFIIAKGLSISVNGTEVQGKPTKLLFDEQKDRDSYIRPYIYRTVSADGVEVFLAVGFTRPIPSDDEVSRENELAKYSSIDAGWTIICNDRAVLYADKTELTGWGQSGVPKYHTQFIAISGIVEFRSADPAKLPTTTTKHGIDASSKLYLQIRDIMIEGMKQFTSYTNKWKKNVDESKLHMSKIHPVSYNRLKELANSELANDFTEVRKGAGGTRYSPNLPQPVDSTPRNRKIAFSRPIEEVEAVGDYLFGNPSDDPSVIGARCFELILDRARTDK